MNEGRSFGLGGMNNGVYYLEEEEEEEKGEEVVVCDERWVRRKNLFEQHWTRCQQRIDEKRAELNNSVLNTLLSHQRRGQLLYKQTQERVVTCILNMGSDIASRSQFFMQYEQRVMREDVQLIRLNSEQVGTGDLKAVCRVIVRACCVDEGEDEDGVRLGRDYDIERVLKVGRKLYITIEDAEKWSVELLDGIVAILRLYAVRLGIVLTMGVCAPLQHFQDELLLTTIANLNFSVFDTRSSSSVDEVVDAIVFHKDTIQAMGPNLLRYLMRSYKDRMENIEELIAGFKYAFMLHCYADQVALVTLSRLDASLLTSTTEGELLALRRQHSLQKYFDQLVEQKRTATIWPLVNDDDAFRAALPDLASKVLDYHALLNVGLHVLHVLINFVKKPEKSHTQKWILYCKALEGTLVNDPLVRGAVQRLSTFPPGRLASFLKEAVDRFPTTVETKARLMEMHHKVVNLKISDEREGSMYVEIRPKIVDYIKRIIGSLQPPDAVPFAESFYFDYLNMHDKMFAPSLQTAFSDAWCNPSFHLNCTCCLSDNTTLDSIERNSAAKVLSTRPPTSIAYQEFLQSLLEINIHDWFIAYEEIIKEGPFGDLSTEQTWVQFSRCLDELNYLGFIKLPLRKPDWADKMVYG